MRIAIFIFFAEKMERTPIVKLNFVGLLGPDMRHFTKIVQAKIGVDKNACNRKVACSRKHKLSFVLRWIVWIGNYSHLKLHFIDFTSLDLIGLKIKVIVLLILFNISNAIDTLLHNLLLNNYQA